ncbi:Cyclo(L-leucyl-L-leucyl) synthase [Austwickia sp. TVS 96-490-7B]|uniref:tRNA-dependent cyclodipeptide synthase n=1 Tax=Austwickia sp. TVS 96-490-7B TaxID=2830843 RepID=UPI001C579AB9|nr:tRNA-dependent cyclodipeptide synthase [Austwickia sp. TVS 96-490-7B]MBW3084858.1 Cyclo(L-leucyl-L-leucyl) synthase [Austwickia sp. TVS 96-490-7B]
MTHALATRHDHHRPPTIPPVPPVLTGLTGLTSGCQQILDSREHLLLGISPFSSKFDRSYLSTLFRWAHDHFRGFDVLIPGALSEHLLRGAGSSPTKAAQKCRRETRRQLTAITDALTLADTQLHSGRPFVISEHIGQPLYQDIHTLTAAYYQRDEAFRAACRDMSAHAVDHRRRATTTNDATPTSAENLDIAVEYIFGEMPFFLAAAPLCGLPRTCLTYYRNWPISRFVTDPITPLTLRPGSGFAVGPF